MRITEVHLCSLRLKTPHCDSYARFGQVLSYIFNVILFSEPKIK